MLGGILAALRNHQILQVMAGGKPGARAGVWGAQREGLGAASASPCSSPGHGGVRPPAWQSHPGAHPRTHGNIRLEQLRSLPGARLAPAARVAQIAPVWHHPVGITATPEGGLAKVPSAARHPQSGTKALLSLITAQDVFN